MSTEREIADSLAEQCRRAADQTVYDAFNPEEHVVTGIAPADMQPGAIVIMKNDSVFEFKDTGEGKMIGAGLGMCVGPDDGDDDYKDDVDYYAQTRQWDARGYIPARRTAVASEWTWDVGGLPTTPKELEGWREAVRDLPPGLKATMYRDLHREGLRISDAEKQAAVYEEELRKGKA